MSIYSLLTRGLYRKSLGENRWLNVVRRARDGNSRGVMADSRSILFQCRNYLGDMHNYNTLTNEVSRICVIYFTCFVILSASMYSLILDNLNEFMYL